MPELSGSALEVAESRYFLDTETKWSELAHRQGQVIGANESQETQEEFERIIFDQLFIPGGRILRNAGRKAGSMMNCAVLPITDSREGIGQLYKELLILWGTGSGCGVNFTPLRYKGAPIHGVGGKSSGLLSFLKVADSIGSLIESGGSRRSAGLALVHIDHPEVEDVINAKLRDGEISNFNISIGITREFLDAVRREKPFYLRFGAYKKEVDAKDLWYRILSNMLNNGEPGLIYLDNFRKNNSFYFSPPISVNPCVTGDTLVYTADGRGFVPIKKLVEEDKDVPVFSYNEKTKKPEVKIMRHPRKTGFNKKILRINLNDGGFLRCTEDHKIYLKDGSIKFAKDLIVGDSLHHLKVFHASFEEIFKGSNSKSKDYIWLNTGNSTKVAEHRFIAEFKMGRHFKKGEAVHHIDYNTLNNSIYNIDVMSKKDHDKLHSFDMMGANNPSVRFPEKNWLIRQDWSGENNGRYLGVSPPEVFDKAVELTKKLGRRITKDEWHEFSLKNNLPISNYACGKYSCMSKMLYAASRVAGVEKLKYSAHIREYKRFLKLKATTDLNIFFKNGCIYVNKKCEWCNKEFTTKWSLRERSFCSLKCSSEYSLNTPECREKFYNSFLEKQKVNRKKQIELYLELKEELNRVPLKKEWENLCKKNKVPFRIRTSNEKNINEYCFRSYKELKESAELNFKVVSVEFDGYEDVYNGTVDNNHNFYSIASEATTQSGKPKFNCLLSRQCGEQILGPHESCDLGSINLTKFITSGGSIRWAELKSTIRTAVRFLDNVLDINRFDIKEMAEAAANARRIGLGTLGLADLLFHKELRYGSVESIDFIERLYKFIRDEAYIASVDLAKERGSFTKFDRFHYLDASFIRKLPVKLRLYIEENGIRNTCILTQPPTGTTSLIAGVTSGIEPLISKAHYRHDRISKRSYIHPIYKDILLNNKPTPDWYVDSYDLTPEDHLETQVAITKYNDSGTSKTINIPNKMDVEEFDKIIREYIQQIKGVTVYREGSRENQILTPMSREEAEEELRKEKVDSEISEEMVQCATGACEI